jgi:hypothetical protein
MRNGKNCVYKEAIPGRLGPKMLFAKKDIKGVRYSVEYPTYPFKSAEIATIRPVACETTGGRCRSGG